MQHQPDSETRGHRIADTAVACFEAIDNFVVQIYEAGFLHSCIVHCVVLTLLALVIARPRESKKPQVVTLSFNDEQESPVVLEDSAAIEFLVAESDSDEAVIEQPEALVVQPSAPATLSEIEPLDMTEAASLDTVSALDEDTLLTEVRVPQTTTRRTRVIQVGGHDFQAMGSATAGATGDGAPRGGGIGGEMGRRLKAAGAQTGDVQVSIAWNNANDIDVHVMVEPLQFGRASNISFMSPQGICGGMLDVDANAHPFRLTNQPVENVFWRKGMAPFGRYTIAVHHFQNWAGPLHTDVDVAVLVDGKVEKFKTMVTYGGPLRTVTSFVRRPPVPAPPVAVFAPSAAE